MDNYTTSDKHWGAVGRDKDRARWRNSSEKRDLLPMFRATFRRTSKKDRKVNMFDPDKISEPLIPCLDYPRNMFSLRRKKFDFLDPWFSRIENRNFSFILPGAAGFSLENSTIAIGLVEDRDARGSDARILPRDVRLPNPRVSVCARVAKEGLGLRRIESRGRRLER